jgi:hypothetical protein
VDVGAAFIADEQSLHLVEPAEGAFDDPAVAAEPGAMVVKAVGEHGLDPPLAEHSPVGIGVIAAVADHSLGALPGTSGEAGDRGDAVEQRHELGDVVAVAGGQRPGERCPERVGQEVVLGARTAPVNWARARFGAPFLAWIWLESTTARDHSISPAARNRFNNNACSRSHTPARCHSSSRRQQVIPEPNPSSWGRCIQAVPVWSTNRIPESASRSERRLRPGYLERRSRFGKSGSTSSHNSSDTTHGEVATRIPPRLTTDADGLRRPGAGPFILK